MWGIWTLNSSCSYFTADTFVLFWMHNLSCTLKPVFSWRTVITCHKTCCGCRCSHQTKHLKSSDRSPCFFCGSYWGAHWRCYPAGAAGGRHRWPHAWPLTSLSVGVGLPYVPLTVSAAGCVNSAVISLLAMIRSSTVDQYKYTPYHLINQSNQTVYHDVILRERVLIQLFKAGLCRRPAAEADGGRISAHTY